MAAVTGGEIRGTVLSPGQRGPSFTAGAALLSLGLVALVAAFGVAEARRRRAPAGRR